MQLTRQEVLFLLNTLESVEAELEQLEQQEDWFITQCGDQIESSKEILTNEFREED